MGVAGTVPHWPLPGEVSANSCVPPLSRHVAPLKTVNRAEPAAAKALAHKVAVIAARSVALAHLVMLPVSSHSNSVSFLDRV